MVLTGDLYHRDEVPDHFKELFIFSGYRNPRSSPKQCLMSIFGANNETLNFWTHFLPAMYYWYLLYSFWDELRFGSDHFSWPMLVYLLCVCLFPITSAVAHIFNTMSDSARHVCFFFDYSSLSIYSLGTAIAYKAYVFDTKLIDSIFADLYLYLATLFGVVCIVLSCQTRFMQQGILKKMYRTAAFAIPYTFDSVPLFYRIAYCSPEDCTSDALQLHFRQFMFASAAAFFYLSHYPERFWPGKFDILGHSHQIFHIFSVLASHDQVYALLLDLKARRHLVTSENIPSFAGTLGLMGSIVIINLAVMGYFALRIYREIVNVAEPGMNGKPDGDSVCNGAQEQVCNGIENADNSVENMEQVNGNGKTSPQVLRRRSQQMNGKKVD